MATINVKNNRAETLVGPVTVTGKVTASSDLRVAGKFEPLAVADASLSGTAAGMFGVYNNAGTLLGYVKYYPAA